MSNSLASLDENLYWKHHVNKKIFIDETVRGGSIHILRHTNFRGFRLQPSPDHTAFINSKPPIHPQCVTSHYELNRTSPVFAIMCLLSLFLDDSWGQPYFHVL